MEHLYRGYLDFYSKGGKIRRIYITDSLCKEALEWCGDIALLADLMGHESIETTRIYLTRSSKEQQLLLDEIVT